MFFPWLVHFLYFYLNKINNLLYNLHITVYRKKYDIVEENLSSFREVIKYN